MFSSFSAKSSLKNILRIKKNQKYKIGQYRYTRYQKQKCHCQSTPVQNAACTQKQQSQYKRKKSGKQNTNKKYSTVNTLPYDNSNIQSKLLPLLRSAKSVSEYSELIQEYKHKSFLQAQIEHREELQSQINFHNSNKEQETKVLDMLQQPQTENTQRCDQTDESNLCIDQISPQFSNQDLAASLGLTEEQIDIDLQYPSVDGEVLVSNDTEVFQQLNNMQSNLDVSYEQNESMQDNNLSSSPDEYNNPVYVRLSNEDIVSIINYAPKSKDPLDALNILKSIGKDIKYIIREVESESTPYVQDQQSEVEYAPTNSISTTTDTTSPLEGIQDVISSFRTPSSNPDAPPASRPKPTYITTASTHAPATLSNATTLIQLMIYCSTNNISFKQLPRLINDTVLTYEMPLSTLDVANLMCVCAKYKWSNTPALATLLSEYIEHIRQDPSQLNVDQCLTILNAAPNCVHKCARQLEALLNCMSQHIGQINLADTARLLVGLGRVQARIPKEVIGKLLDNVIYSEEAESQLPMRWVAMLNVCKRLDYDDRTRQLALADAFMRVVDSAPGPLVGQAMAHMGRIGYQLDDVKAQGMTQSVVDAIAAGEVTATTQHAHPRDSQKKLELLAAQHLATSSDDSATRYKFVQERTNAPSREKTLSKLESEQRCTLALIITTAEGISTLPLPPTTRATLFSLLLPVIHQRAFQFHARQLADLSTALLPHLATHPPLTATLTTLLNAFHPRLPHASTYTLSRMTRVLMRTAIGGVKAIVTLTDEFPERIPRTQPEDIQHVAVTLAHLARLSPEWLERMKPSGAELVRLVLRRVGRHKVYKEGGWKRMQLVQLLWALGVFGLDHWKAEQAYRAVCDGLVYVVEQEGGGEGSKVDVEWSDAELSYINQFLEDVEFYHPVLEGVPMPDMVLLGDREGQGKGV